eukprot:1747468-Pyramimonas_sp.AAC.1
MSCGTSRMLLRTSRSELVAHVPGCWIRLGLLCGPPGPLGALACRRSRPWGSGLRLGRPRGVGACT